MWINYGRRLMWPKCPASCKMSEFNVVEGAWTTEVGLLLAHGRNFAWMPFLLAPVIHKSIIWSWSEARWVQFRPLTMHWLLSKTSPKAGQVLVDCKKLRITNEIISDWLPDQWTRQTRVDLLVARCRRGSCRLRQRHQLTAATTQRRINNDHVTESHWRHIIQDHCTNYLLQILKN